MKRLALFALVSIVGCASASTPVAPPPVRVEASSRCFVLREVGGPVLVRRGGELCARRVPPASTFKVPHALVALAAGARTGPDDLERWDGTRYPFAAWNADQTLASAIRVSAVWYFQRTAERIGRERMVRALSELGYGNALVGEDLTHFWLEGPLGISADEQASFFDRFARRDLPVDRRHVDAVEALVRQPPGAIQRGEPIAVDVTWDPPYTELFAKTGSTDAGGENVRWLVGFVRSRGKSAAFASLVVARRELSTEAVFQAMHELRDAGWLRAK